jgi:hypothetical protein
MKISLELGMSLGNQKWRKHATKSVLKSLIRRSYFSRFASLDFRLTNRSNLFFDVCVLSTARVSSKETVKRKVGE